MPRVTRHLDSGDCRVYFLVKFDDGHREEVYGKSSYSPTETTEDIIAIATQQRKEVTL